MTLAGRNRLSAAEFSEKEFYLEEFRGRTLCVAVALADCDRQGGFEIVVPVLGELADNDTRVILLLGVSDSGDPAGAERQARRRLRRLVPKGSARQRFAISRGRRTLADCFADFRDCAGGDRLPVDRVWKVLRERPLCIGFVAAGSLVSFAQRLAVELRLHKLVLVDPSGGVSLPEEGQLAFMDGSMLDAVLQTGQAEWVGVAERRATFQAVRAALLGGVDAVNLCTLKGLARELYTYEGAGTLFTLEDYCRVERLGIDDFEAVERLIERGEREGYLKPRDADERLQVLMNGYGATIGTYLLAGVCGLDVEAYRAELAGEIVSVYTITRFKTEGVGGRMLKRVLADASEQGLRYVFACTTNERAQAFFNRHGFREVSELDVPAAKWAGYDGERRRCLKVFRRDMRPRNDRGPGQ